MGQAKPLDVRQKVVGLKESGKTHAYIAEALQISVGTVKNLWKRYQVGGESGLCAKYQGCGRRIGPKEETLFRFVRLVKHLHPTWGIPLIVLKISEKYPDLKLQSIRRYQGRLLAASGKLPRAILPPTPSEDKARIAHDTWQIDAKERFCIQNGEEVCYLTIVDEGTGSLLAARAFPPCPDQSSAAGQNPSVSLGPIPSLDNAQSDSQR